MALSREVCLKSVADGNEESISADGYDFVSITDSMLETQALSG